MLKRKEVCDDCLRNDTPLHNFTVGWVTGIIAPAFVVCGVLLGIPVSILGILLLCSNLYLLYDSWVERATWHYYAGWACVLVIVGMLH